MIVGYRPYNLKLYKLATKHTSIATPNNLGVRESNERLEYLGDAILGAIVAEYLFKKYPFKDEGFLTEIRARIVNRESLNNLGKKVGLRDIIQYDSAKRNLHAHKSIFGDTMEAVIGAVYLDRNYKYCKQFVLSKLIEPHFNIDELVNTNLNYKSRIIEWSQKNNKTIKYELAEMVEKGNFKEFEMLLYIDDELISKGHGQSKKKAEQAASRKACELLKVE